MNSKRGLIGIPKVVLRRGGFVAFLLKLPREASLSSWDPLSILGVTLVAYTPLVESRSDSLGILSFFFSSI